MDDDPMMENRHLSLCGRNLLLGEFARYLI
jgi:hypothetical protein